MNFTPVYKKACSLSGTLMEHCPQVVELFTTSILYNLSLWSNSGIDLQLAVIERANMESSNGKLTNNILDFMLHSLELCTSQEPDKRIAIEKILDSLLALLKNSLTERNICRVMDFINICNVSGTNGFRLLIYYILRIMFLLYIESKTQTNYIYR